MDGCHALRMSDRMVLFQNNVRDWLNGQYGQHLKQAMEDVRYFQQLGQFYQALAKGLVPVQIMTDCYGQQEEKSCYQRKVQQYASELVGDSVSNAERLRVDMATRFLQTFPFETVKTNTVKTFQDFIGTQRVVLDDAAQHLWDSCQAVELSNSAAPQSGFFSVGDKWMVSSQFNCLNERFEEVLQDAIGAMSMEGREISSAQEQMILRDISLDLFKQDLQRHYQAASEEEHQRIMQSRGTAEELEQFLKLDFAWLSAYQQDIVVQCMAKAVEVLPKDTRYHSVEDLKQIVRPSCERVSRSSELSAHLVAHPEFQEDFHLQRYLADVTALSEQRVTECKARYPANNLFQRLRNRNRRLGCYNANWEVDKARLLARAKTEFKVELSPVIKTRMEQEGRRVRSKYKDQLVGDILPIDIEL